MRAIWYETTGPAREVLRFGELERPPPGPGEVRVRVAVSGVNPSDTKRRAGWIGLSMRHSRIVPHSDGAGTIRAKAAVAREGGARHVIDYRREDVASRILELTEGAGVDRVIEVDLAANLETDVSVLRPNGTIASYSSTSGPELRLDYYPLAFKDVRIHFVQGYLLPAPARRAAIRDLTTWLAAGQLEVRIAKAFPLAETASAHELLESGRAGGKVLVET